MVYHTLNIYSNHMLHSSRINSDNFLVCLIPDILLQILKYVRILELYIVNRICFMCALEADIRIYNVIITG